MISKPKSSLEYFLRVVFIKGRTERWGRKRSVESPAELASQPLGLTQCLLFILVGLCAKKGQCNKWTFEQNLLYNFFIYYIAVYIAERQYFLFQTLKPQVT